MRKWLLALSLLASPALAQSVPNGTISQGQVWTPSQWNSAWQFKIDVTGGIFTGAPTFGTITGSTQCLHVNSAGLISGTGSDCGAGGGGSPGGSTGQIQFNNSGVFGGLSNTALTADINVFSTSLSGAVPASGGGTTTFLRADGTFATPSGGGNVSNSGTPTSGQIASWTGSTTVQGSSLSSLLDTAFGATQGAVIYRGASGWAELSPGTSGNFLETQGASANPVWAATGVCTTGCSLTTTTLNGATSNTGTFTSSGAINSTGGGGYQVFGLTMFNISNATVEPGFFMGPFAGASMPVGAQFLGGIGPYAGESVNVNTIESEFVGHGAGIAVLSGGGVSLGTSTCAAQTTSSCFAIGSDAMRDFYTVTDVGSMGVGNGSLADGTGTNVDIAIGGNTLWGAAATITFTNSAPHVGDVYTLSTTTSNACNGTSITINCTNNSNNPGTVASTFPVTTAYTVVSGDTTATILVGHLATAWSGSNAVNYILADGVQEGTHNLFPYVWQQVDTTNHPTVLKGHYPGSWLLTPSVTCTGTCTNAQATVGTGYTGGNNILLGAKLFISPLVSTAQFNTIISASGPANFVTNNQQNTLVGYGMAAGLTGGGNGGGGNTGIGANALQSLTSGAGMVAVGAYAGAGIIGGTNNTVIGSQSSVGSTCITSGSSDLEIGAGSCVVSPTTSNQMSIQNGLFAQNLSGTGATVSPAQFGIDIKTPTATFTISDAGGTTTTGTHLSVVQTTSPTITSGTATLDTAASDVAGTVTEGTAQTGFTLTFNRAYATTPHCGVWANNGVLPTAVTPSTTTLVVANTSATSDIFTYACFQ